MSKRVICTKCGHENEMSGIFCRECGEKLDFKNVQAEHFDKGRGRERSKSAWMSFLRLIRLVVVLGLLAGVGLLLWPKAPFGEVGTAQHAESAKAKIINLHEACEGSKASQSILTEQELNAYLGMLIAQHNESSRDQAKMDEVNLMVSKVGVTVFASMKVGPATLTYEVEGKPVVGAGGFQFEVGTVTAGHLPLPGPLATFIVNQVSRIFSEMEHEKYVLDHLSSLEVGERRVRVSTP